MAQKIIAYTDAKGRLHDNPRSATIADLAALFGSEEGMATGIATTVLEQRAAIEKILGDHDFMLEDHILVKDPDPAA